MNQGAGRRLTLEITKLAGQLTLDLEQDNISPTEVFQALAAQVRTRTRLEQDLDGLRSRLREEKHEIVLPQIADVEIDREIE